MKYTKMTKREIVEYGTEVGIKLNKKLTKAKLIAQLKSYLSTLEVEETSVVEIEESPVVEVEETQIVKAAPISQYSQEQHFKDVHRMLGAKRKNIDKLIGDGAPQILIENARKRYEELCKEYPV